MDKKSLKRAQRQKRKELKNKKSGRTNTPAKSTPAQMRRDVRSLRRKTGDLDKEYELSLSTIANHLDTYTNIDSRIKAELVELGDLLYADRQELQESLDKVDVDIDAFMSDDFVGERHDYVCESFSICSQLQAIGESFGARYARCVQTLLKIGKDINL